MAPTLNNEFELMGMSIGDGCISVNNRYKEYALLGDIREEKEYYNSYVIPLFNKIVAMPLLKKKISGKAYLSTGVYGIITFEPKIVNYFINLGLKAGTKRKVEIPDTVMKAEIELQKAFLRGLFDTDGSIYFEKNYTAKSKKHVKPKIKLSTVSVKLKEQIKQLCKKLGISVMDKKSYKGKRDRNSNYEIVIYRKNDIDKWIKEIGFNNPKHKTKICIWKKLGYCPPNTKIKERISLLREIGVISS